VALRYFVPRLSAVARNQADARSLMTGRITDAYTNIATVKLFSHAGREADYARSAMREFLTTVHRQMRLVSGFEVVNHILNMMLIIGASGVSLYLWTQGKVGIGAVAASTAMALRLNGIAHWVMWEMSAVRTRRHGAGRHQHAGAGARQGCAGCQAAEGRAGRTALRGVSFSYGGAAPRPVVDRLDLVIRPGEKIGLVGRSGAGKSTIVNLLLRFYDIEGGRITIDGQDIAHVPGQPARADRHGHAGHLAAASFGAREHDLWPSRRQRCRDDPRRRTGRGA
jgi:ATP-binding cassette subfamily B multidrug efflux pump